MITSIHAEYAFDKIQNLDYVFSREDGRGVNGSHTDLPGPIWNYNSIVEKQPGTNN